MKKPTTGLWRNVVAFAWDAACLALLAAAVVIAATGGYRGRLSGIRVSLTSSWRAVLAALLVAGLRVVVMRRPSPAENLRTAGQAVWRMSRMGIERTAAGLDAASRWTGETARRGLRRAEALIVAGGRAAGISPDTAHDRDLRVKTLGEALELLLVVFGLIVIYRASPLVITSDGRARYTALSMLLTNGEVSPTLYSMVGPLFATPLWWLGRLVHDPEWWCARYNFLLFAASLPGFYLVFTPSLGRRLAIRFLLLVTAASMFPNHLGNFYGEVFTALCVGLGLGLVVCRDRYVTGWTLVVLGVVNTPAATLGLVLAAGLFAWQRRRAAHLVPILVGVALIAAEAWLRRGGPLVTGYEGNAGFRTILPYSGLPGFSYPFFLGLVSILVSCGRGLLFFAPGLLLLSVLWRQNSRAARTMSVLWTAFFVGLFPVYAKWWAWYGGVCWGPRFFLFGSLLAALAMAVWLSSPIRSLAGEAAGAAIVVWSCWVGVNGLVFSLWDTVGVCGANNYALEFLCWYVPEFSPLFRPFIVPGRLLPTQKVALAYAAFVCLYLVGGRLLAAARWLITTQAAAADRSPVMPAH